MALINFELELKIVPLKPSLSAATSLVCLADVGLALLGNIERMGTFTFRRLRRHARRLSAETVAEEIQTTIPPLGQRRLILLRMLTLLTLDRVDDPMAVVLLLALNELGIADATVVVLNVEFHCAAFKKFTIYFRQRV